MAVAVNHPALKTAERLLELVVVLFAAALVFPITVNWIILVVGIVLWIAVAALRFKCKEVVLVRPPLLIPLLGMTAVNFLNGAVHGGISEAVASVLTLRPMICYFWAHDALARNNNLQVRSLAALLALSAVAGYWSTVQQVFNFHPFGYQYLQGTGFLNGPMAFAGQMQLFSMIAIALLIRRGYRIFPSILNDRTIFSIIAAGNILGVIFASERSAWLGFAVGLFTVSMLVSWKLTGKIGAVAAVLAALGWSFIPVFQKRLLPLLDWHKDVSTRARLIVWQTAWQCFQQNPWFGVGVRKFPKVVIQEALVPGQAPYLAHGHSNYFHILATMGATGFAVYIWLIVACLRLAWMQAHIMRKRALLLVGRLLAFKQSLGLGMFGALVSLAVSGAFEYNFGTGQVRLAEWFLLAMLMVPKAPPIAQEKPVPNRVVEHEPKAKRKAA